MSFTEAPIIGAPISARTYIGRARIAFQWQQVAGNPEKALSAVVDNLRAAGAGYEVLDPTGTKSADEMKEEVYSRFENGLICNARRAYASLPTNTKNPTKDPNAAVFRVAYFLNKAGRSFNALDPMGQFSAFIMAEDLVSRYNEHPASNAGNRLDLNGKDPLSKLMKKLLEMGETKAPSAPKEKKPASVKAEKTEKKEKTERTSNKSDVKTRHGKIPVSPQPPEPNTLSHALKAITLSDESSSEQLTPKYSLLPADYMKRRREVVSTVSSSTSLPSCEDLTAMAAPVGLSQTVTEYPSEPDGQMEEQKVIDYPTDPSGRPLEDSAPPASPCPETHKIDAARNNDLLEQPSRHDTENPEMPATTWRKDKFTQKVKGLLEQHP